ncbi:MAG TPA: ferredoxin [Verrucomicrobiae bacterium]
MADRNSKAARNATGKFYVDTTCVDCDLCRQIAPESITRDAETGNSYVFRQPESPHEIAALEGAISNCPTESIGSDGLSTSAPHPGFPGQPAAA